MYAREDDAEGRVRDRQGAAHAKCRRVARSREKREAGAGREHHRAHARFAPPFGMLASRVDAGREGDERRDADGKRTREEVLAAADGGLELVHGDDAREGLGRGVGDAHAKLTGPGVCRAPTRTLKQRGERGDRPRIESITGTGKQSESLLGVLILD